MNQKGKFTHFQYNPLGKAFLEDETIHPIQQKLSKIVCKYTVRMVQIDEKLLPRL